MFKIGIFAIILDEQQRVLLCHRRDYDLWNLPGGGLEKGESPWEGIIREVKEEKGLDVEVDRLAGVYSKPDKDEVVFSFVCKVVAGRIAITGEADKTKYFEFEKLSKNSSPKQIKRIRDALDGQSKMLLKVQQGPSSIDS